VVEYVAKTPRAIGYVSRAFVIDSLSQDRQIAEDSTATPAPKSGAVRVVGIDGMWPVDSAIQNQIYPLSYPLYLVSRREPTGRIRQFIDFALSPAGQSIVGRYHVRVR
jgi:phosphate transport system substrate-binding protein